MQEIADAFSHPLVQVLGWTLIHFVWQGMVVGLLVAGALGLLRHSTPGVRYAMACGGLLVMLCMPIGTLWLLYPGPGSIPPDRSWPSSTGSVVNGESESAASQELVVAGGKGAAVLQPDDRVNRWVPGVVVGWIAGLLVLLVWRMGGWIYVQYLRKWGGQPAGGAWQVRLAALVGRLELNRPVQLLETVRVEVPMVIGWLRPVILMPVGILTGLTAPQVEAILLHELTHIRRCDYLVNLVQTAVEILLFYHPAIWWVSRQIRREREYCCDDEAARLCGNPLVYASALAELEERRQLGLQVGIAASSDSLFCRIERLFQPQPVHARWHTGLAMAAPVIIFIGALLFYPQQGNSAAGPAGRIVFFSTRDGNNDIYAMDADGKNVARLTYDRGDDLYPRWSPDGRRIAFQSNRDGNHKIYVMEANGSHLRPLTHGQGHDLRPQWSPGGSKIAFFSSRDGDQEIYVVDVDGGGLTRLTYAPGEDQNPSWSPDGSRIAFMSTRDGNHEIYVMNEDGTVPQRLTRHEAEDAMPSWSPAGQQIAFCTTRDGNDEIYAMNADGTEPQRLTYNMSVDADPVWSPDGQQIAFCTTRDGNTDIYVMNADGTDPRPLTRDPALDAGASWTAFQLNDSAQLVPLLEEEALSFRASAPEASPQEPDLRIAGSLAFVSFRDNQYDICTASADGSGQVRLTHDPAGDGFPAWSPDRTRISFMSFRDGNAEIYIMNADGTDSTRLTYNGAQESFPRWSPDGNRIAFMSTRDSNAEIYLMNTDGTEVRRLTQNPANGSPAWSPDGSRIAFMSTRDGNAEIYIMNADGTGTRRLTFDPVRDDYPSWSPDGSKIAFASTRDTDEGDLEIYVMNTDGTGIERLTHAPLHDLQPSWSPEGSKIVFHSNRTGQGTDAIYTMNPDGSEQELLLSNPPGIDNQAAWASFQCLGIAVVGTSITQKMIIENKGLKTLVVSDIIIRDNQFAVSPKRFEVAAGGRQEVRVRFTPNSMGTQYAALEIRSNDPDTPLARLTVNGAGMFPKLEVAGR